MTLDNKIGRLVVTLVEIRYFVRLVLNPFYWTVRKAQNGDQNDHCDDTVSIVSTPSVVPTKTDIDVIFCSQSYQGLRIDRSLVF